MKKNVGKNVKKSTKVVDLWVLEVKKVDDFIHSKNLGVWPHLDYYIMTVSGDGCCPENEIALIAGFRYPPSYVHIFYKDKYYTVLNGGVAIRGKAKMLIKIEHSPSAGLQALFASLVSEL